MRNEGGADGRQVTRTIHQEARPVDQGEARRAPGEAGHRVADGTADHGPEGLTRKANDGLYSAAGLGASHAALRPGGVLAVWSSGPNATFARRLRSAGFDVNEVKRPPWFTPMTTSAEDQLAEFLRRREHFALVVDEYGALMGLVTLEDILEEIVGDIKDEHDIAVQGVRPQPDGSVNVDGSVPIRDLNRVMNWDLPDEEAVTVAGLVIHEAQAIPDPGQRFAFHGYRFQVLRRQRNQITALRVEREVEEELEGG